MTTFGTTPAFSAPRQAMTSSGLLSRKIAITSPGPNVATVQRGGKTVGQPVECRVGERLVLEEKGGVLGAFRGGLGQQMGNVHGGRSGIMPRGVRPRLSRRSRAALC